MPNQKQISCQRCQVRKIKCNKLQPCSNCARAGHTCEYRSADARRRPVSHQYLSALESRVRSCDSFIRRLKSASHSERDVLLNEFRLDNDIPVPSEDRQRSPLISESQVQGLPVSLRAAQSGILQYHGPTSIHLDGELLTPNSSEKNQPSGLHGSSWSHMRLASVMGIDHDLIRTSFSLFFSYRYSEFMFIYREALLMDYFEQAYGGKYWSFPLVFAVCALGAAYSNDPNIRSKSSILSKCAHEIIITQELSRPAPTTIQALLCLAFYELEQGNSSQGWLYAGMSFRMGQDIGFQHDPTRWIMSDQTVLTQEDIRIRRRIYWGCCLADKLISLIMGRPVYLQEMDSSVDPTEFLPEFPGDHNWFGIVDADSLSSPPNPRVTPRLLVTLTHSIGLSKIVQKVMTDIFAPAHVSRDHDDGANLINRLADLNVQLTRWHFDLPEGLKWTPSTVQQNPPLRHVLVLQAFFHSVTLSLNRHFIRPSQGFPCNPGSRNICIESCNNVMAVIRQFKKHYDLVTTPLIMIYAIVMSAVTLIYMAEPNQTQTDPGIPFFLKTLQELSPVSKMAEEARLRLLSLLQGGLAKTTGEAGLVPRGSNLPGSALPETSPWSPTFAIDNWSQLLESWEQPIWPLSSAGVADSPDTGQAICIPADESEGES